MKTNKQIEPWKGDKRYTAIAARAAALKKAGHKPDAILAALSEEFGAPATQARLREQPQPAAIYGVIGEDIDTGALAQLQLALQLPIAIRGALMPDAHPGYALPVGGVFAAHRAVAPAMVGVDIGCRMHLTIFEEPPELIQQQRAALFRDLQAVTVFGVGAIQQRRGIDHEILNEQRWQLSSQTRGLLQKAAQQLGTSGSGNHFAELIIGERLAAVASETIALPQRFCGLLTHSGSRGIGYAIANQYMRVAAQETSRHARVPRMYEWLELDGDAGKEYWLAMQLAGDYAQANHEVIHAGFVRRAKLTPLITVQNHHNFAWLSGDMVIHRKGATPAEKGVLGIIPGSMASASYLVEGCGVEEALCSAAHGAGRLGSRNAARSRTTLREVQRLLAERDVLIQGLSVDESPLAYKDIERVMALHYAADLVRPLARMQPIAVIMAGEEGQD